MNSEQDQHQDLVDVENTAMRYLARREYGRLELRRKLLGKRFADSVVDGVLHKLEQRGYLSDQRYVELMVRSRLSGRYGPLRIRAELTEKGVDERLVDAELNQRGVDWFAMARAARHKRFGAGQPEDFAAQMKQKRYLQNRGFSFDQINAAFADQIKNPES